MEGTAAEMKRKSLLRQSRGVGWYGIRLLILAAVYVGTGRWGLLLGAVSGFATLVWVPSGLAVTALFLWGSAWWPAITLGAFLLNLLTGAPWFVAVGISIGNTLEALICTALLKRGHVRPALDSLHDVLILVLLAAPTGALVSATLGVSSLRLGGIITWSSAPVTWSTWWFGDMMSLLLLAPFLLTWSAWQQATFSRTRLMELSLLSLSVLVIGLFVFLGLLRPNHWEYPITHLVVPLLTWGALRFGPRGATAIIMTFASLAIGGTILGVSPFSTGSLWLRLLFLQSYMGIMAATTLILAAIVSERYALGQRTQSALRALVAMGEAMVRGPQPAEEDADAGVSQPPLAVGSASLEVAKRLAELTQSGLACRQVSMAAVDPHTRLLSPITVVGLLPEQEQAWWASWFPPQRLEERFDPNIAVALEAGDLVLLDTRSQPERYWHNLSQAQSGLMTPMRLGEEVVGVLFVDYGEQARDHAAQEEHTLTGAIARLGALLLERDRLLRCWAEARANVLALGETKAQMETFLGIASHELKSPLTALKLGLHLTERRLQKLVMGQDEAGHRFAVALTPAQDQLTRTACQAERLERLINDLLDVSRIQAGKLDLRLARTELVPLVQEAVEAQRQAQPERTICLQVPADLQVFAEADAGRLEQVVINYLTNALKYSPADRSIAVGIEGDPQQVRVWVRDEGSGLPVEEQERIWECFYRAQGIEVQSGASIGLGLGLHICRTIIELHQGQVGVQSEPGHGATFWFTLPGASPG
jgi:signal transduction histidine kinase/integral membrane sensor domain MASE1